MAESRQSVHIDEHIVFLHVDIEGNVFYMLCYRKQKLGFKRIMLFTNNDNPHPDGQLRVSHFS